MRRGGDAAFAGKTPLVAAAFRYWEKRGVAIEHAGDTCDRCWRRGGGVEEEGCVARRSCLPPQLPVTTPDAAFLTTLPAALMRGAG